MGALWKVKKDVIKNYTNTRDINWDQLGKKVHTVAIWAIHISLPVKYGQFPLLDSCVKVPKPLMSA